MFRIGSVVSGNRGPWGTNTLQKSEISDLENDWSSSGATVKKLQERNDVCLLSCGMYGKQYVGGTKGSVNMKMNDSSTITYVTDLPLWNTFDYQNRPQRYKNVHDH